MESETIIKITSKPMNNSADCKYLGIHLDRSLSMSNHIYKVCKRAFSRLGLLRHFRSMHTINAALNLYEAMGQPVMTYCSAVLLFMPEKNRQQFELLEKRAEKIIFGVCYQQSGHIFRSFANSIQKMQCADFVVKCCLRKIGPCVFHDYFERVDHHKATCRNFKIPRANTETTKEDSIVMELRSFTHCQRT